MIVFENCVLGRVFESKTQDISEVFFFKIYNSRTIRTRVQDLIIINTNHEEKSLTHAVCIG